MKKIKFFALTALFCAMGTNAFAYSKTGESATKLFTFEYDQTAKEAKITGFVSELDAEFKSAVAIPATVTDPVNKDSEGKLLQYDVIEITAGAFEGEPINTISFFAPAAGKKGIEVIGAGAFAGTNIATLDLSNTKITTVENLFGTEIAAAPNDKVNSTLTSVTLPGTWTVIAAKAFENCTALATINFGTATAATQAFGKVNIAGKDYYNNFAGCPLTALDFTGTKVTEIPAGLLYDGTKFKSNSTLTTVTLTDQFAVSPTGFNNSFQNCTALATVANLEKTAITILNPAEFKGDAALATINTSKIGTFDDNCFDGCTALATISFKKATYIGVRAFAATALTSVEFPATGLYTIDDQAFFECDKLTTATLGVDGSKNSDVNYIGDQAFAYSGLTAFEIPATTTAALTVGSKAFAGTPIKSFSYKADVYDEANQWIPMDVFYKCSGVQFVTTDDFITDWNSEKGAPDAPTNSTFSTDDPSKDFTVTAYKNNPSKFYVKWYDAANYIQVKRSDCKVYAGFHEGDKSLGMIQYKADNKGMITIGPKEAVIIITEKEDLTYIPGGATSTSWMGLSDDYDTDEVLSGNENALKYCTAATTRGTLENQLTDDTYYIYGWVNSAKGTGFQKITSGTAIPKGTLFAFAKEPVAGARMTIKWYDEDGNLEGETTAIDAIENVATEAEGETYNLAGQKVNAAYKGVIVKNGKKLIRK